MDTDVIMQKCGVQSGENASKNEIKIKKILMPLKVDDKPGFITSG